MADDATVTIGYPNERWMRDLSEIIQDRCLRDIVIPGSHDAGTWKTNDLVRGPYAQCQGDDLHTQMLRGSRYLDLRLSYDKGTGDWYFYHGSGLLKTWFTGRYRDLISQLKEFLEAHPEEIVIATLLLDGDSGKSGSLWTQISNDLAPHLVSTQDLKGKSVALATPRELRRIKKNFILFSWGKAIGDAIWGADSLDRGGVYNDVEPKNLHETLRQIKSYNPPPKKMFIYHLGQPAGLSTFLEIVDGDQGMYGTAWRDFEFYFREKHYLSSEIISKTNILNVDYVEMWADAIIALNKKK